MDKTAFPDVYFSHEPRTMDGSNIQNSKVGDPWNHNSELDYFLNWQFDKKNRSCLPSPAKFANLISISVVSS